MEAEQNGLRADKMTKKMIAGLNEGRKQAVLDDNELAVSRDKWDYFTKPGVRFYEVDDVVVKLVSDGKTVSGFVVPHDTPFPPAKAVVEGHEITRDEAKRLIAAARAGST